MTEPISQAIRQDLFNERWYGGKTYGYLVSDDPNQDTDMLYENGAASLLELDPEALVVTVNARRKVRFYYFNEGELRVSHVGNSLNDPSGIERILQRQAKSHPEIVDNTGMILHNSMEVRARNVFKEMGITLEKKGTH